jgi:hypothetical protein
MLLHNFKLLVQGSKFIKETQKDDKEYRIFSFMYEYSTEIETKVNSNTGKLNSCWTRER